MQSANTNTTRTRTARTLAAAGALASVLLLGACSSQPGGSPSSSPSTVTPSATAASAAQPLTVAQPWVKAAAKGAMTGVFATLENTSGKDVTVTSAEFPGAGMVELHETVTTEGGGSKMQEAKGGFTVKAGETFQLKPGGNHIMLMGLTQDIKAGETYTVTLVLSDGTKVPVKATARDFTGAQETYNPATEKASPSMSMSPSMSHSH